MKNNLPKILLVDDNPSNLIALNSVLAGEEYILLEASSGEEAIATLLCHNDVSLVLMDVQMPGLDGFETSKRIKEMPQYKNLPIVFITAIYRDDPHIKRGFDAGGIDYFGKPFDPDILKKKVGIYVSHHQKEKLLQERELRLQMTENLLKMGRRLTNTIDKLPIGIIISNLEGKVIYTNSEVMKILTETEALDHVDYKSLVARALAGQATANETLHIGMNGESKYVNCSASPLLNLEGEIYGAGIIIQDVTESRKMEEEMEKNILGLMTIGLDQEITLSAP